MYVFPEAANGGVFRRKSLQYISRQQITEKEGLEGLASPSSVDTVVYTILSLGATTATWSLKLVRWLEKGRKVEKNGL